MHDQLKLRLFGAFEVRLPSGRPAALGTRKCEALLAYLAFHAGEPQSRERLATLLWSGSGDRQARHSLRQALAVLRRALDRDARLLQSHRDTVTLGAASVDVVTFRQLAHANDARELMRAVELYGGPLLAGMTLNEEPFDEWLVHERSRLANQAVGLLLRSSELNADEDAAAAALRRALDIDPVCEEAHRRLMRSHIDAGRYNAAILQYQVCAQSLRHELDASPEPQTAALYARAAARSADGAGAGSADSPAAAASGERKYVTVVCVALFPTSHDAETADPELAFNALGPALDEMRSVAERAGGTTIADERDALTIVFGAPVALENHAASACRAALNVVALIENRRSFPFRPSIAIDTGEVVVRAPGGALRRQDVFGHCVRRAVRLATSGRIDRVGATQPVAELASRYWRFTSVDAVPLDDAEPPVPLLAPTDRADGSNDRGLATAHASPFVGRQRELRELETALAAAAREAGQLVAVVGEPGIGKSRLFHEFLRSASGGWDVAACAGDAQGSDAPYSAIAALIRSCLAVTESRDAAAYDEAVRAISLIDPALERFAPALLSVLAFEGRDAAWAELEPAQKRHQIIDAVALMCHRKAAARPLIVAVEDLHWLDAASRRVLERLVEAVPASRMLLMVNYRPGFAHEWSGLSYYRQIQVAPLSAPSSAEFVARLIGDDVSLHAFRRRLVDDTGGNPFFIEECLRALRASTEIGSFSVPETVQGVIAARIDQLQLVEKRVLQHAAAIGSDVPYAVLSSIGDVPDETLRRALRRLQAAEFLYETGLGASETYRFKHALTNEVAYGTLLTQTRRELHARIVTAIERIYAGQLDAHVDALAYHSARAGDLEATATYGARAGLEAAARGANRIAAAYFDEALSALARLPQHAEGAAREIDLRFEMRNALFVLGEQDAIRSHLDRAEALAERIDDPVRRGYAAVQIGAWYWQQGQPSEARAAAERALAFAQRYDDRALTALAWYRIGLSHHASGDYLAAVDGLERATGLLDEHGNRTLVAHGGYPYAFCCSFLCWSLAELGDFTAAHDWGRRGWRLAKERNHVYTQTVMAFGLGHCYLVENKIEKALPILETGLEQCRIAETGATLAWVGSRLGLALVATGRHDRGFRLLRETLKAASGKQFGLHYAQMELRLAEAALLVHDSGEARLAGLRALGFAREHGERANEAWAERILADASCGDDVAAAFGHYERAIALARELRLAPRLAAALLGLTTLLRTQGRDREADAVRQETESLS